MQPILTPEQYAEALPVVTRAREYAVRIMRERGRNYLTAEEASHPDYAACSNELRGQVEQYEILTNPPEHFVAYIGNARADGMGIERRVACTYPVHTWTGAPLGNATCGQGWSVRSYVGTRMYQFYARIAGREYTGRSYGEGMSIVLRETAASKRARA